MVILKLEILIGFYISTVIINVIVALIQYFNDRKKIQKIVILYWLGILISSVASLFIQNLSLIAVTLITSTGVFISQIVLAFFLSEIRKFHIHRMNFIFTYLLSSIATVLLSFMGVDFQFYAPVVILGAISPMLYAIYFSYKKTISPTSIVQKMFTFISLVMSLHYLDWPFFMSYPNLFFTGYAIAFVILYIQSILMPMLTNEKTLQDRNNQLEDEVLLRAKQLTEAQKQLWDSNKLASIGRMAGGIAHEINNPLTIINMYTDLIHDESLNEQISPREIVQKSKKIQEAIERISHLTDGLRKVAKDHRSMEKNENDLRQVISDTLSFCTDRMKVLNIRFSSNIPDKPMIVFCNSAEISQIILNLLNNAIDAISVLNKRQIILSVTEKDHFYELSVEDSGIIDPAIVPRIMDPFFSSKPQGHSTGLGLSIGRAIAENHGGKLYLDMNSLHTRFVLELPQVITPLDKKAEKVSYEV